MQTKQLEIDISSRSGTSSTEPLVDDTSEVDQDMIILSMQYLADLINWSLIDTGVVVKCDKFERIYPENEPFSFKGTPEKIVYNINYSIDTPHDVVAKHLERAKVLIESHTLNRHFEFEMATATNDIDEMIELEEKLKRHDRNPSYKAPH